ncbi:MAG: hypothetical protein WED07_09995 [Candidatus Freyarchaeum deiterrae]
MTENEAAENEEFYKAKISSLIKERIPIIEELKRLRESSEEYKQKRNEKNREVQLIAQQIKEIRGGNDESGSRLNQLKAEKEKLYERVEELSSEIREQKNKLKPLDFNGEQLRKKRDELEWKQQTTTLSLEEENAIVKEIDEIEAILPDYTENLELQETVLAPLRKEMAETWEKINSIKKEMQEEYDKNKPQFDQAKLLYAKRDEVRTLADIDHKNYIEILQKIIQYEDQLTKMEDEISLLKIQRIKMQRDKRENAIKEKRRKAEELIQNKVKQAQEKLEKKKRVTLQELKLAMGEL